MYGFGTWNIFWGIPHKFAVWDNLSNLRTLPVSAALKFSCSLCITVYDVEIVSNCSICSQYIWNLKLYEYDHTYVLSSPEFSLVRGELNWFILLWFSSHLSWSLQLKQLNMSWNIVTHCVIGQILYYCIQLLIKSRNLRMT